MNVAAWRRRAAVAMTSAGIDTVPALEADVMLCHTLGVPRTWLYAHSDDPLDPAALACADALLARRLTGEPVAYLTGEQEFRSRTFRVDSDVLIPRDDTETLVDAALLQALRLYPRQGQPLMVVDAGTGSGIVAISLALELAVPATLIAIDRSHAALKVAGDNATRLDARVHLLTADWLEALGDASVDLLVCNPPYIRRDDPHLAALAFEPRAALVAGDDGLQDLRRLSDAAVRVLVDEGALLLEHGFDQGTQVRDLLRAAGFDAVATLQDANGNERVSVGLRVRRPAAASRSSP